MEQDSAIEIVCCHAAGEVGDVIVGGVEPPAGETLWEQSRALDVKGGLKDFVLNEPRGGVFRHANLLVPPKHPRADAGFLIMEPETLPPMSGSNTMCVTTVLLETGILPMREPETHLTLETPGGLVNVTAQCSEEKVTSVTLKNLPSFADRLDAALDVPGLGTLKVDIAFGGDSFVVVSAHAAGFSLTPDEARDLTETGMKITAAAQEQIGFQHPTLNGMNEITFCLFADSVETDAGRLSSRHAVAIKPGKLDRSPTGTGCSARLALLSTRGQITAGEEITFHSVLGSEFTARIEDETEITNNTGYNRKAIIPSVTGSAWITGRRQLTLDPTDPWPAGYRLSDTWPAP